MQISPAVIGYKFCVANKKHISANTGIGKKNTKCH